MQRGPAFELLLPCCVPRCVARGSVPPPRTVPCKVARSQQNPCRGHMVSGLESLLENPPSALQSHGTCCLSPARELSPFLLLVPHQHHEATLTQLQKCLQHPETPCGWAPIYALYPKLGWQLPRSSRRGRAVPQGVWQHTTSEARAGLGLCFMSCLSRREKQRSSVCRNLAPSPRSPQPHESC